MVTAKLVNNLALFTNLLQLQEKSVSNCINNCVRDHIKFCFIVKS